MLTEMERQIQAFKTKCIRRLLRISCKEHTTNKQRSRDPDGPTGIASTNHQMVETACLGSGYVARHDALPETELLRFREGQRGGKEKELADQCGGMDRALKERYLGSTRPVRHPRHYCVSSSYPTSPDHRYQQVDDSCVHTYMETFALRYYYYRQDLCAVFVRSNK